MKLRARWTGLPPRIGDYLASSTKPRFAYRVRGVTRVDSNVCWGLIEKAEVRRLVFDVDRVAIGDVPAAARVHPWRWDSRAPKKLSEIASR